MLSHEQARAALTETSLADLYVKAAAISGGKCIHGEFYSWTKNPYADWYSKVFNVRIPAEQVDVVLRKLCNSIAQNRAPKNILLGPAALPYAMAQHLADYGFNKVYAQTGMALDLAQLDFQTDQRVRVVDSEPELMQWLLVAKAAFGKERHPALFKRFMKENDVVLYAGYLQDRLVATTMLYMKSAVAGIHLVGTLPECRGLGFATALTGTALRDARNRGCAIGALQASAMGKNVYLQIGFKEYGEISHWEYPGLMQG
jgi:ribosomal protein S18 acetylase RimI-like enzyme